MDSMKIQPPDWGKLLLCQYSTCFAIRAILNQASGGQPSDAAPSAFSLYIEPGRDFLNHTIAAIATPQAAGGIGVIRISGPGAIEIADAVFDAASGQALTESKGYRAHFGRIFNENGPVDEAIALVFRAPHSYTGEDVVELSCHGGLFLLQQALRAVFQAGASPAAAGEFTRRAFLNGKMDLTQAESVMGLIGAQGSQAARAALNAHDGALSREIRAVSQSLLKMPRIWPPGRTTRRRNCRSWTLPP